MPFLRCGGGRGRDEGLGFALAWLGHSPALILATSLSYLLSVAILALIDLFYKASGHSCGVAGPLVLLLYLFNWWAFPALILLPLNAWARKRLEAHSLGQVVAGAFVAVFATAISIYLVL